MPVSSTASVIRYLGNGVSTVFAYPFRILAAADLQVIVGGVVQTTGFTVSGAGNPSGGNVTFSAAPGAFVNVVLIRNMTLERTTDYQPNGDLLEETLDADQDAPIMMIQQLAEKLNRIPQLPVTASLGEIQIDFPVPNALLGWNGTGTDIENKTNIGGFPTLAPGLSNIDMQVQVDVNQQLVMATKQEARGFIGQLTTSYNSATKVQVAAGSARDSTGARTMMLPSALLGICQTSGAWTAGNDQNKLDTGARALSSVYHIFLIARDDGTTEILFSGSATAPTLPSGYTRFRRIGSFLTDASNNIRPYVQEGDLFLYSDVPPTDVSVTNLASASGTLFPLSVPTTVNVEAIFNAHGADSGANQIYLSSPTQPDNTCAPTSGRSSLAFAGASGAAGQFMLRTDTSGRIRARAASGTSGQLYIGTVGWRDTRGRWL